MPERQLQDHIIPRTLFSSASLILILLIPLSLYSVKFFNEANENRMINEVVAIEVSRYEQVTELQKSIATSLQKPVSLKVNQVFAEQFDPLIPPTFTPTATLTPTSVPTFTSTPTLTATPVSVQIVNAALPKLNIYQSPNGPVIGQARVGQNLILLYNREEVTASYGCRSWMKKNALVGSRKSI